MGEVAGWKKGDFKSISITYFKIYFFLAAGSLLLRKLSPVAALLIAGASLWQSAGCRQEGLVVGAHQLQSAGSVVVAHGLSCPAAYGIFPDQEGSNQCLLHCKADS